jgi:hypothetical protein
MKATAIQVGGTYEVRFSKGVSAKALLVREVTEREEYLKVAPLHHSVDPSNPGHLEALYECHLMEPVGRHRKGYTFWAKARSVLRPLSLPKNPGQIEIPGAPGASGPPKAVTDAVALPGAGPTPPRPPEARQGGPTVLLTVSLTLPSADLVDLLVALKDCQPVVREVTQSW